MHTFVLTTILILSCEIIWDFGLAAPRMKASAPALTNGENLRREMRCGERGRGRGKNRGEGGKNEREREKEEGREKSIDGKKKCE